MFMQFIFRLPCELIPPRQCFHLADKLITAREFNLHVRPARTKNGYKNQGVRVHYSDDEIRITHTVRHKLRLKSYLMVLKYLI